MTYDKTYDENFDENCDDNYNHNYDDTSDEKKLFSHTKKKFHQNYAFIKKNIFTKEKLSQNTKKLEKH